MEFTEFKAHIESWVQTHGVDHYSTPRALLLATIVGMGELAHGVLEGPREAVYQAIGSMAVTLVNYSVIAEADMADDPTTLPVKGDPFALLGEHLGALFNCSPMLAGAHIVSTLSALGRIASDHESSLPACCELAWNALREHAGR